MGEEMCYNQPIYEEFDSDDNKKIFYSMYREEFERMNQLYPIINEETFIKEIKKLKQNGYYSYRYFNNYYSQSAFNYNLETKYINNYINFYNFNRHYNNLNNLNNLNNQYGYLYRGKRKCVFCFKL